MNKEKLKFTIKLFSAVIITLGLSISIQSLIAAWNPPLSIPPDANVSAPVNVGSSSQIKIGSFGTDQGIFVGQDLTVMGNVGIGENSPGQKLVIGGGGNILFKPFSGEDAGDLIFQNSAGTQKGRIWTPATSGSGLLFSSGDLTPDITINSSGNVGIGTETPEDKLHIVTTGNNGGAWVSGAGTSRIGILNNMGAGAYNSLTQAGDNMILMRGTGVDNANSGGLVIAPWSNSAKGLRITPDGNVGIGASNPNAKLTIVNNVATGFLDNYSEYQAILWDGGSATGAYGLGVKGSTMVFNSGGGAYSFDAGGAASRMVIDTTGNVGIGTTNPTAKLEVNGKIIAQTPLATDSVNTVATKGYVDAATGGGYINWNDCEYIGVENHRWGREVSCSSGYQMVSWSGTCSGTYGHLSLAYTMQNCSITPTSINSVNFYSDCYGRDVHCNNATGGIKCCRYVDP